MLLFLAFFFWLIFFYWKLAAKYDVAISTACHELDYIVVETTTTAQSCVELLRHKDLGVATFMILVYLSTSNYLILTVNLFLVLHSFFFNLHICFAF